MKNKSIPLESGQSFEVPYPFVRDTYLEMDSDGHTESKCWRPGVEIRTTPYREITCADAYGSQILTVISTHKPGKFPMRVFYTRKWRDPDGKVFGKNSLCCRSEAKFRELARGYRYEVDIIRSKSLPLSQEAIRG